MWTQIGHECRYKCECNMENQADIYCKFFYTSEIKVYFFVTELS